MLNYLWMQLQNPAVLTTLGVGLAGLGIGLWYASGRLTPEMAGRLSAYIVPLAQRAREVALTTPTPYDDVVAEILFASGERLKELARGAAARALVKRIIEQHRPTN